MGNWEQQQDLSAVDVSKDEVHNGFLKAQRHMNTETESISSFTMTIII